MGIDARQFVEFAAGNSMKVSEGEKELFAKQLCDLPKLGTHGIGGQWQDSYCWPVVMFLLYGEAHLLTACVVSAVKPVDVTTWGGDFAGWLGLTESLILNLAKIGGHGEALA